MELKFFAQCDPVKAISTRCEGQESRACPAMAQPILRGLLQLVVQIGESGEHEMTLPKLISLATIYSRPPEELFRRCLPEPARSQAPYHLVGPNTTVLVTGGPLEQQARHLLPDSFSSDPLPEDTMLLRSKTRWFRHHIGERSLVGVTEP
jgi:hypothetical protein